MSRPEPDARTAADLLHARLATQLEALDRELVAVRAGHPEGVHQARIACRRLRSALATFRPLFDPTSCTWTYLLGGSSSNSSARRSPTRCARSSGGSGSP